MKLLFSSTNISIAKFNQIFLDLQDTGNIEPRFA